MRRILLALAITICGLAVTWIFLRPQEWQSDSLNTKQAVAVVTDMNNEVSRQTEGRLLWSPIRKGDRIFAGDKIKTSGLSSARIQFESSKSRLDIEENSIVVVALDQNKFSLNMLEGRVFVQGNEGKDDLNLLSAGKKLDVSGNTAISVTQTGESNIESFDEKNIFHGLRPSYAETVLTGKNEIDLTWESSGKTGDVSVYLGESPLLLKKVSGDQVPFSTGKIKVPMKPGTNYWQLAITENGQETRSALMKLVLNRPLPPTPIYPLHKEIVMGNERAFDFKWNKGSSGDVVNIEVARDADFKNKVVSQKVKDQTFFTPDAILPEGDYFWRISFALPTGEPVISPATIFTVHRGSGILSPSPLLPMDRAKFYLGSTNETEIKFEWKKQENVTFDLKVMGDDFSQEVESSTNSATIRLTKTGSYKWEVTSRTADGKKSVLPSQRTFEVKPETRIQWLTTQKQYQYLENLPVVILRWQKTWQGSSVLRVGQSPDLKDSETFNVSGKDFPFRPSQDGLYYAKVSGVDDQGQISANSDIFDFEIKQAPLPPAPVALNQQKNFRASTAGDLQISVANQKPNWLLIAQLVDVKGGILDERRFNDPQLRFSGLLPGKYLVRANYQDEFNRKGEVSILEIDVPEKTAIPAPKLKGVKVR